MLSLIPRFSPWHAERPTQGQYEIQNAVKGVSGIYTVHASTGEVFQAYCDMVTDGGYWILIERWTVSPTKTVTWAQVAVRDTPLNTFSNSPASFPVIPQQRPEFRHRGIVQECASYVGQHVRCVVEVQCYTGPWFYHNQYGLAG